MIFKIFLVVVMIPICIFSNMDGLKKELDLRIKHNLIMKDMSKDKHIELAYFIGKSEAYFEILELIENE